MPWTRLLFRSRMAQLWAVPSLKIEETLENSCLREFLMTSDYVRIDSKFRNGNSFSFFFIDVPLWVCLSIFIQGRVHQSRVWGKNILSITLGSGFQLREKNITYHSGISVWENVFKNPTTLLCFWNPVNKLFQIIMKGAGFTNSNILSLGGP